MPETAKSIKVRPFKSFQFAQAIAHAILVAALLAHDAQLDRADGRVDTAQNAA